MLLVAVRAVLLLLLLPAIHRCSHPIKPPLPATPGKSWGSHLVGKHAMARQLERGKARWAGAMVGREVPGRPPLRAWVLTRSHRARRA